MEVELKPNEPVFMQGHSHITENVGGTACQSSWWS